MRKLLKKYWTVSIHYVQYSAFHWPFFAQDMYLCYGDMPKNCAGQPTLQPQPDPAQEGYIQVQSGI